MTNEVLTFPKAQAKKAASVEDQMPMVRRHRIEENTTTGWVDIFEGAMYIASFRSKTHALVFISALP